MIWGEIMGDGDRAGRPKPAGDAQIAAVARRHNLTLVTRNTRISRTWMWLLSIPGTPAGDCGEKGHGLPSTPPIVLLMARGRIKARPRFDEPRDEISAPYGTSSRARHRVRRYRFTLPHGPTLRLHPERVEVGAAQVESEADGLSGQ